MIPVLLGSLILSACAAIGDTSPRSDRSMVDIDGEAWYITLVAAQCEARVPAAVAEYWKAPLYRIERTVTRERFFINESSDCWVELSVEGVDDSSVLFKVTPGNVVIDKRSHSFWRPHVRPYPIEPVTKY